MELGCLGGWGAERRYLGEAEGEERVWNGLDWDWDKRVCLWMVDMHPYQMQGLHSGKLPRAAYLCIECCTGYDIEERRETRYSKCSRDKKEKVRASNGKQTTPHTCTSVPKKRNKNNSDSYLHNLEEWIRMALKKKLRDSPPNPRIEENPQGQSSSAKFTPNLPRIFPSRMENKFFGNLFHVRPEMIVQGLLPAGLGCVVTL